LITILFFGLILSGVSLSFHLLWQLWPLFSFFRKKRLENNVLVSRTPPTQSPTSTSISSLPTPFEYYDVCIVGAGPAGATCAYYLAKAGLKVILFDKSHFPRDKICGDTIPPRVVPYLREMGVLEEGTTSHHSPHTVTLSRGLVSPHGISFMGDLPPDSEHTQQCATRVMQRIVLDYRMVLAAQRQGVVLREGARVRSVKYNLNLNVWTVSTINDPTLQRPENTVVSRVLIGADGACSWVGRHTGLVDPLSKRGNGLGIRWIVEGHTHTCQAHHVTYYPEAFIPGCFTTTLHLENFLTVCAILVGRCADNFSSRPPPRPQQRRNWNVTDNDADSGIRQRQSTDSEADSDEKQRFLLHSANTLLHPSLNSDAAPLADGHFPWLSKVLGPRAVVRPGQCCALRTGGLGLRQTSFTKGRLSSSDSGVWCTYGHALLLVGEAAGLVDPMTGRGLDFAILSAIWASEVLLYAWKKNDVSARTLQLYQQRWQRAWQNDFVAAKLLMWLLTAYPHLIDAAATVIQRKGEVGINNWDLTRCGLKSRWTLIFWFLRPDVLFVLLYYALKYWFRENL
jgi:flavin-dependent dehydrogenase